MKTGIIHLALVPVRKEPDDRAEMVNQLLFGEGIQIMEKRNNWTRIKSLWDNYGGWIDTKQFTPADESLFQEQVKTPFCADLVHMCSLPDDSAQSIVLGSCLPSLRDGVLDWGSLQYKFDGDVQAPQLSRDFLMEQALHYLHAPYLWGGRSPFGIDCSGFTQMVYKMMGIQLKRDASQQAKQGRTLSFIEEAQTGDLAFFDNAEGKIIHVGIMMENHHIIHASGKVRIDKIDHQGIFNVDTGKHTHKLRLITNILD